MECLCGAFYTAEPSAFFVVLNRFLLSDLCCPLLFFGSVVELLNCPRPDFAQVHHCFITHFFFSVGIVMQLSRARVVFLVTLQTVPFIFLRACFLTLLTMILIVSVLISFVLTVPLLSFLFIRLWGILFTNLLR